MSRGRGRGGGGSGGGGGRGRGPAGTQRIAGVDIRVDSELTFGERPQPTPLFPVSRQQHRYAIFDFTRTFE